MKQNLRNYFKVLFVSSLLVCSLCSLNSIRFCNISEGLEVGIQGVYGFVIMYIFSLSVFKRKRGVNKIVDLAGILTFPLFVLLWVGIPHFQQAYVGLSLIVIYMLAPLIAYFIQNKELYLRLSVFFIIINILLYMAGSGFDRIIELMSK